VNADANIHGSAVLLGERGVLIRGASGSGKSSLAFALIEADHERNRLVADDRVDLVAAHGRLLGLAPAALAGRLELRGVGILAVPFVSPVRIHLVVDLLPPRECPRLPEPDDAVAELLGVGLPRLALPAGAAGHAMRIRAALASMQG
jgi:serine kinase of HPr protein (carbohydrate metabolism regulator)